MVPIRFLLCAALAGFVVNSARGQAGSDALKKELEALYHIEKVLDQRIETKDLQEEMPFSKLLNRLEQQACKNGVGSVRLDTKALGDKVDQFLNSPVKLPPVPKVMRFGTALRIALSQIGDGLTYEIEPWGIVVVSDKASRRPSGLLHSATYDIRRLVERPELWTRPDQSPSPSGNYHGDIVHKAALIVKDLINDNTRLQAKDAGADAPTIEVLNGTQLRIRAPAVAHAQVIEFLEAVRGTGDIAVTVKARLYEVDDAFYTQLKNSKRVPPEELERQFLAGEGPKNDLFTLLEKQKPILAGDEVKVDSSATILLLSKHRAIRYRPKPASPGPLRMPDRTVEAVLDGIAFRAEVRPSEDRRFVRIDLSEKATELQEMQKRVLWDEVEYDLPVVRENSQTQMIEIPDGGSILVPVSYRPKSLRDKNRWWVLSITPRIVIEEEEKQIRQGMLDDVLPKVVADVLTNPRLKATRNLFGTPDDKRFALVKSDWFTWPANTLVAGFQVTPAAKNGKRVLGIRIDRLDGDLLTVTVLNAGGADNGEAIGGCTLRYRAKAAEKGYSIELLSD